MVGPLLARRVAVATGAGRGIGRAIARSLRSFAANVVPAGIDGDPAKTAAEGAGGPEREAIVAGKRAGGPAEVAGAAVFLASDLAGYITGTMIEASGGRYI